MNRARRKRQVANRKPAEPDGGEVSDEVDDLPAATPAAMQKDGRPVCVPMNMLVAPAPDYSSSVAPHPPIPEPLYSAPPSLMDDIQRHENQRSARPELFINRVVFDSFDSNVEGGSEPATSGAGTGAGYASGDTTLTFESRFESGNLRRAVQVGEWEYDLYLNPDWLTKTHTQWYHYRLSNTRRGPKYKFNIVNMVKPSSVYSEGQRPLCYSVKAAAECGLGWHRCGIDIAYYPNSLGNKVRRDSSPAAQPPNNSNSSSSNKQIAFYTLTFAAQFEYDNDTVSFAHCYPYTLTDLQRYMSALEADPFRSQWLRRRRLCETLAGNACDLITITSFSSNHEEMRRRKGVVITARVHPGESNASWMMHGVLDFLTGETPEAHALREGYVFKLIPMLNPDGVVVGNYRCSLSGQDLNRCWIDPSRRLHPTIFCTKQMVCRLQEDREVVLFCDLHGHSRKKNMFMYGNSLEDSRSCRERVFPYLLSQAVEYFDFGDCNFRIQKAKEATARVVMYRELSISNSYTLEASFCGSDVDHHSGSHFNTTNYQHMGRMLCSTILEWAKPDQVRVASALVELQAMMAAESEEHVAEEEQDVSDPEDDEPATDQPTKTTRDKPTAKDREDSNGAKLIRAQQQQQQKRRTRRRALREAAFIAEMTELNNTAFFMPSIIRDVTAKTPSVVRRGQATRGQNAGELRRTESLGSSSNGMAPCSSANARKGREGDAARRDMSMDGRLQHTALPATGGGRSKVPRKAPETPPNKPLAAKSSQKGVTGTNANGPPTLLPARPVHRLLLPHAGTLKRTSTPPSPALMRPPSQPPFSPSPSPPPSYQQWVGGRLQGGRRSDLPGGGAGTASQRGGNGGRGRASRPLPLMSLNVSVEGKTAANLLERGQEVKAKGEVMPKSVSPRPLPVDKKVDKKGKEDGKAVGNSKDAAWETVAKAGSHKKNKAQKRKKRQSKSRAPPLTATQPTATGQSEDGSYAPQDMAVTRPVPRPTPFAAPLLPFPPFLLLLRQPSGAGRLLDPDPGSRSYL